MPPVQAHTDDAEAGETNRCNVELRLDIHIDNTVEAHLPVLAPVLYSFSRRSSVRREIPSSPAATSCLPPDFSSVSRITCSSSPPNGRFNSGLAAGPCAEGFRSAAQISQLSAKTAARVIALRSSRTLPGHP